MFSFLRDALRVKPYKYLAAVFVSLLFFGCGGSGGGGGGGDDQRALDSYAISFYDAKLDLLDVENIAEGEDIDLDDKAAQFAVSWYTAKSTTPTGGIFTPQSSTNFYAIPSVIEVSNQAELDDVRDNPSGSYLLVKDIALEVGRDGFAAAEGWLPIGSSSASGRFKGIFNGNGHKISGLWINRTGDNIGLFGYVNAGTIKNLGVLIDESRGVKGRSSVGAIAGYIYDSSITNAYSTGNIIATGTAAGGIAGEIRHDSRITDSYSKVNIDGRNQVGGITGYAYSDSNVTNSYSTGSLIGAGSVGGIAGAIGLRSTVTNNAAINQEVNGTSNVNRIVGYLTASNTVSHNFALYTTNITPKGTNGDAGTLKSDADFKTRETYKDDLGWKFGPWEIDGGYPYLYWEDR
ncbi:MAG: hypothetical protein LBQ18_08045 [Campylobacteraceae bacterium]|jgi:hypothetical protein|nr:hypothetical protein [Campylobacteraceae bacterium]